MALGAALLCALAGVAGQVNAQDRPLQTADAETLPPGMVRAQVGFDFLQNANFPLSGLTGDLTDIGVINVRMGVGRIVEIQVQGMIQQFMSIKSQGASFVELNLPGTNSTHDVGDFSMWTKVRFFNEEGRRPSLAFRFGFSQPNTNQTRGLGNNASNVFAEAIIERHFGKFVVFGNLGLGILTSPNALFSQNDEIIYGLGFRYPVNKRFNIVGEVAGRASVRTISPALVGTESRSQARLGVQIMAGGLVWDFAGIGGLTKNDPRTGFTFGISKDFPLFDWSKLQY